MAEIAISGVTKKFGETVALDSATLTVNDGDFLALLGPSGCGKSTLLRILSGLLEPTAGTIAIDGEDITDVSAKERDIALVFQSYALYPHLSVRANLEFPLKSRKVAKTERTARVEEVARILEIEHLLERKPKQLSGGQRQRVAVGRALVREPKAFLMDEPLSNLDAKLRVQTRHELTTLHRRLAATIVYVTHDQVEAMTMATRIAVMNDGRIEQIGTPEDVYDRPASVFVAQFIGSPPMNLVPATVESREGQIVLHGEGVGGSLFVGDVPEFAAYVGVRPEHLRVTARFAATGLSLTGTVEMVENLGNELHVTCRVGTERVAVRASREDGVALGSPITLTADVEHVHLFAADSGRRLEWIEEPSTDVVDSVPAAVAV
ncbi:ABC transporter ATP-binding protein [Demequina flava]|uniref:ABC transporter ATP-binding protein n=1 Tax=Demequina flava TaxID=1095025 RepID=UPI0007859BA6|nr:sn-glycerol-3-phosphate ABC transporter ATP-binding protein UgpC [Demequina flava]